MMEDITNCTQFMKLFLSFVDDLKKREIEPKDACEQANLLFCNWFAYYASKDTSSQVQFTFEEESTD